MFSSALASWMFFLPKELSLIKHFQNDEIRSSRTNLSFAWLMYVHDYRDVKVIFTGRVFQGNIYCSRRVIGDEAHIAWNTYW